MDDLQLQSFVYGHDAMEYEWFKRRLNENFTFVKIVICHADPVVIHIARLSSLLEKLATHKLNSM